MKLYKYPFFNVPLWVWYLYSKIGICLFGFDHAITFSNHGSLYITTKGVPIHQVNLMVVVNGTSEKIMNSLVQWTKTSELHYWIAPTFCSNVITFGIVKKTLDKVMWKKFISKIWINRIKVIKFKVIFIFGIQC